MEIDDGRSFMEDLIQKGQGREHLICTFKGTLGNDPNIKSPLFYN